MDASDWTRPVLEAGGAARSAQDEALVFFEIHGDFPASPPEASIAAYRLDPAIGAAVEVFRIDRDLDARRSGVAWTWFAGDHPALAARVAASPAAIVVRARIAEPRDLAYLRHAIGLAQLFLDHGGLAVHDLQTLRWYPADEWRTELFTEEFRTNAHVVILTSLGGDGAWLHTRGMRKFGRPDLSLVRVPDTQRDAAVDLVDRFIVMQALGGRIAEGQEIVSRTLPDGLVCHHRGDLDDPDFNNVHVEIVWPQDHTIPTRTSS